LAQSQRNVNFSLGFRVYAGESPFVFGQESGIFKDLGINANVEGASGSADAIRRLATGTHDFAYADIMTLIEFTVANPDLAPKLILPILDHPPSSIISIGDKKITSLGDLKGKKIGVAANSAATKLLPTLLATNDIDVGDIELVTVEVSLRDTLLLKGNVDGVVGFDYTSLFNLIQNGVPRENVHVLSYSELGFDFPANSLLASRKVVQEQPELCRDMALATVRTWRAVCKDPKASIDAAVKREPLLDPKVELECLQFIIENHVLTENVKANGLGFLDTQRAAKGLELIERGLKLPAVPKLDDFYDTRFLPDAAERKLTA